MTALPMVSCLTVTADRLVLLKEAIACYLAQTYTERELVIVTCAGARYRAAIHHHLAVLGRSDIRLIEADAADATLGALRNISLDAAKGDIVCQWDDDDLYHPDRILAQHDRMEEARASACFLTGHLQYFDRARSLFLLDWRQLGGAAELQMLPGSLFAVRDARLRYPESGADARTGEDNAVRACLAASAEIAALDDAWHLYVYRCHGRNLLAEHHHQWITSWAALDEAGLRAREAALRRLLPAFRLPSPYAVRARGGGALFTFRDTKGTACA